MKKILGLLRVIKTKHFFFGSEIKGFLNSSNFWHVALVFLNVYWRIQKIQSNVDSIGSVTGKMSTLLSLDQLGCNFHHIHRPNLARQIHDSKRHVSKLRSSHGQRDAGMYQTFTPFPNPLRYMTFPTFLSLLEHQRTTFLLTISWNSPYEHKVIWIYWQNNSMTSPGLPPFHVRKVPHVRWRDSNHEDLAPRPPEAWEWRWMA